jgi:hypothetical protein
MADGAGLVRRIVRGCCCVAFPRERRIARGCCVACPTDIISTAAYDVNVPFMQLERHGWDIHAV